MQLSQNIKLKYFKSAIPCARDQSAAATYYYEDAKGEAPKLHEEWIYYRKLKADENEVSLRRQQVF